MRTSTDCRGVFSNMPGRDIAHARTDSQACKTSRNKVLNLILPVKLKSENLVCGKILEAKFTAKTAGQKQTF